MALSAEIRWFKKDAIPDGWKDWFCSKNQSFQHPANAEKPRLDEYLLDKAIDDLGIKHRGGKAGVEIKGLLKDLGQPMKEGPWEGDIEVWSKWPSNTLLLQQCPTLKMIKQRWLRKYEDKDNSLQEFLIPADPKNCRFPARGCNVELTEITLCNKENASWWTFSFESFDDNTKSIDTLFSTLRAAVKLVAGMGVPSNFEKSELMSYAAWLKTL